ncbi:MAG: FtsL-like putative cell division protein [Bacteroidales bacterium]|nr:FtsL-like putative cell division protein [Bacteroidales bacterium]
MANRLIPSVKTDEQAPKSETRIRQQPKPKRKKQGKANPFVKGLRLLFIGFFGGGFLKLINFKKNWLFILCLILMVIFLIYNNLSIQSNRNKIEQLKDEKIKITMEYMKTKQKAIYFDEKQGEQLLEKFKEEGFIQNKSLEYKIQVKEKRNK